MYKLKANQDFSRMDEFDTLRKRRDPFATELIMASLRLCFELSIMVEGLGEGHPMTSIVFLFVPRIAARLLSRIV